MMDRSGCVAVRHGTESAYTHDRCRCADAREAWRLYRKRGREGRRQARRVSPLGTIRRLRALAAIGWSPSALAGELGWSRDGVLTWRADRPDRPLINRTTADRVSAVYDRLCGQPGPSARTRAAAQRSGWVPPLAWDDIDNPRERPSLGGRSPAVPDELAVAHAAAGRIPVSSLRGSERHLAVVEMARWLTVEDIADRCGYTERHVTRLLSGRRAS